jgi:phage tail sheath protein FI
MPEYLAPGVFVEEIDSGSKPIEGVGTNTVAFVGYAKSGDFNKPTFISNWTQFCQFFGEEENAIIAALCDELNMSAGEVLTGKKASRKGWMEFAQALVQHAIREASTNGKTLAIKSFQDFLRKYRIPQSSLPYMDDAYLAHAVRGYYDNGGGRAYIVRIPREDDIKALSYSVNSNGASNGNGAQNNASPAQVAAGPVVFKALNAGPAGNGIRVEVEHVGEANEFKLKVSQGDTTETIPDGRGKPLTAETLVEAVNKSKLIRAELSTDPKAVATQARPEASVFTLQGGLEGATLATTSTSTTALATAGSSALANLTPDDFLGDEAQRTGISGLAVIEDINVVCAPDLMAGLFQRQSVPGLNGNGPAPEVLVLDDDRKQAILDAQCGLVAYCERMGDRMAIVDAIPGLTPQEVRDTTLGTPYNCDRGQAAIYYPWIRVADPLHRGHQKFVPPSGHIAGVWARVGTERGVHKAPANEALLGAVALEYDVTKGEQEILNPEGINCIRSFPGQGIRVWGARTLATVGNPSWKYVNVRRLFNYLEKSMERGLQWVVFEPNDQDLWGRVRRNLSAFLWTEWKEGKLFGATPGEAFYVKCDAETNPQEMIDLGRLYVEIGVNPVKPAEFVIVRMGQWSGGGSTSEA